RLPMSQFNLLFAIQMFIGVAAYVLFVIFAAIAAVIWPENVAFPKGSAIALYFTWILTILTPKIAGIADAALRAVQHYGGAARLLLGGVAETVFSFLLSSISMVGQTIFMAALLFGKTIAW